MAKPFRTITLFIRIVADAINHFDFALVAMLGLLGLPVPSTQTRRGRS